MGSFLQHERSIKGGLPSFRFKVRVGVEDRKVAFAESYHLMDGQLYGSRREPRSVRKRDRVFQKPLDAGVMI